MACRIICGAPRDAHAEPLLADLHLEGLNIRRNNHIIQIVERNLADLLHPAFSDLFVQGPDTMIEIRDNSKRSAGRATCIGVIARIRHKLTRRALMLLYDTLIASQLSYCNIIWASTYRTPLLKIYSLQKRALKLCTGKLTYHTKYNDLSSKTSNSGQIKGDTMTRAIMGQVTDGQTV